MVVNLLLYFFAFIFIWIGSGFIISSLNNLSKKIRLSKFALSFILLGLLTSIPEFAVGLTAISQNDPEIFVGNLLGGIPVIFLLIIPILAIFGNGINLKHELDEKMLAMCALVILAPFLLILDKQISVTDSVLFIMLYIVLLVQINRKQNLFDKANTFFQTGSFSFKDLGKLILGIAIVLFSSNIIVDKTIYISSLLAISPFYISLIVLSLGTNLPELSLAIRSVYSKNKDIAFGDYIGSASVNTLLFGIFSLLIHGEVLTVNNFLATYYFVALGLFLFYYFSRSKNNISRKEGFVLLGLYVVFVISELLH